MNIITAEEFFEENKLIPFYTDNFHYNEIYKIMIEFAKLHVESCKEEIADDYTYYLEGDEGSEGLNKTLFFKEAYPLENIK
jgi:hypothetical protein